MEVLMHLTRQLEACIARMTPEQYARLLAFAEALLAESSAPSEGDMAQQAEEAAALEQRIQHAFPDHLRQRLRELTRKSEVEALTTDERAEYIALAEQREEADSERLQVVLRLAQLRGVPPTQLLEELGIGAAGHGCADSRSAAAARDRTSTRAL
jgi:excinuclease UvrABC nuclease subunit